VKVGKPTREGVIAKFTVQLTLKEITPAIDAAFKDAKANVKLDGFRPGKIPMAVLKKRFGNAIHAEALEKIFKEVYPKAIDKTELQPLTPANIEEVDFDPEKHLKFTAVVEMAPEFEADNWKGVEIEREIVNVTDEDVARHIESLRNDKAIVTECPEDGSAESNDRLKANVQELDGEGAKKEGRYSEGMGINLGTGVLGKDTDDQLIGVKVGETRTLKTVRTSTDKDGKESIVKFGWEVEVTHIDKVDVPEFNDDFAVSVNEKYENTEDMSNDVRSQLDNFAKYQVDQRMAGRLLDAVIDAHEFEVPPTLVEQTLEELVESKFTEAGSMIPKENLRENLKDIAERQIRWFFLRSKLIETLEIKATDEDVDKQISSYAEKTEGVDLKMLTEMFKEKERRQQLVDEIIQGKLMEALKENANIIEKEVDFVSVLR
jgi:trigger factor